MLHSYIWPGFQSALKRALSSLTTLQKRGLLKAVVCCRMLLVGKVFLKPDPPLSCCCLGMVAMVMFFPSSSPMV